LEQTEAISCGQEVHLSITYDRLPEKELKNEEGVYFVRLCFYSH
jgi:hypothetical protein